MSGWNEYRISVTWWQPSDAGTGHDTEHARQIVMPRGSSSVDARNRWGEECEGFHRGTPAGWSRITVGAVQIWRHTSDENRGVYPSGQLDGTWDERFAWPPSPVDDEPIDEVKARIRRQLSRIADAMAVPE